MKKEHILLVEDDNDFGSILKQYLEIHSFEVQWEKDGQAALNAFERNKKENINPFDICVFDVMIPYIDGFTLAEKVIDIQPGVPFIFLTAKKMKEDRIRGLKLGADDYIVKPFEADILVLKLKNILKRSGRISTKEISNEKVKIGLYVFDPGNHILVFEDKIQKLTEKETALIGYFFSKKNEMIKREDLLTNVWGTDDFFSGRSMDVFVSRLRKYFREDENITIESARGIGLTFKIK